MKRLSFLISLVSLSAIATMIFLTSPEQGADHSWADAEQARLEIALKHAEPGSALAFKLQTKLDRIDDWYADQPQAGFPDEFNRVLYEMRIPSDLEHPEYEPGYRFRELAKVPRVQSSDKSLVWESRGPGNVAGRARGAVVDPDDPSALTWFIAAVGGGVWHTADGGATWANQTDDMPTLAVQSLAMAGSNHNVLYAGTGESFYNVDTLNGNGILKTTDRGLTWAPLPSTMNDPRFNNVSRIVVDPNNENIVVASATTGFYKTDVNPTSSIFRSTDGGASWTEVHNLPDRIQQVVADPTNFNNLYAAVYGQGVLKSIDAGLTWSFSNTGISDLTGRFELAVSPINASYIFAASQGGDGHSELWVSLDGGLSWSETTESGSEPNWLGSQGWYDNTIVCHPTDPAIVYVGGPQLWKIDMGSIGSTSRTSTPLASYSFPHPDHHGLTIVHDGGGWWILGTNDGGLTRTASGETGFTVPTTGMTTTQFYGVDKRPGASAYIGGMQDNGTWRSPDDPTATTPWTFQIGGDGYETSWHFDDPSKMIGGYQYNGFQRSLDGGLSWSSATGGLSDTGAGNAPFITKIGKSNARPDHLFVVGASGIWRSTDFGGSWNLSTISSGTWGSVSSFMDVRVSEADPDVVWAGSRMDIDADIMVSTDGGVTFNATTDYTDVTMGRISGLSASPHDPATAYVLFSYAERPKILKTTDHGATWADISGFGTGTVSTNGFPDVAVYDLMVFPNDVNKIWVGSEIGLIESTDGGANWALAVNGLPSVGIWKLAAIEDEIVLATHGRGIWTTTDAALMNGSTYNPLLNNAAQNTSGDLHLEFNLRSAYDSTEIVVNGIVVTTVGPNTPLQIETLDVPVLSNGTLAVYARSFKGGDTFLSITKNVDVTVFFSPITEYTNVMDLNGDADDFQRSGFQWSVPGGFSDGALHTTHDYGINANYIAMLLKPLIMSPITTLTFDEVAIVEPGSSGSTFGDSDFWDYVIVEGTVDGINWVPVAPGYDARADSGWLSAYDNGSNGSSSMYRQRTIDLNATFSGGDTILLRFRLYADGYVESWGWAIDNIVITSEGVTAVDNMPGVLALGSNYPNPFNPQTTISFNLPKSGRVELSVFDIRGRLVRTLMDGVVEAGTHSSVWNGRNDQGAEAASGTYFYQLRTDSETLREKMVLLK
jgi:hypothetical protein